MNNSKFYLVFLLSCLSFFGGLGYSATFIGGYNWQYDVLSDIIDRSNNPEGYVFACLAFMTTGIFLFPLTIFFRQTRSEYPLEPFSRKCLITACFGLLFLGVSELIYFLEFLHEVFAVLAFGGLTLSSIFYTGRIFSRNYSEKRTFFSQLAFVTSPLLASVAILVFLFAFGYPLGLVDAKWNVLDVPIYLSLAFWEWATCGVLFLYFLGALLWQEKESQ